jgi:hypothetical protein
MTSADLTDRLRTSRPVAPDALRERVRAIAAAGPAGSRFAAFRLPRLRLVVPAVAATAIAAAALIAIVRPEHQDALRQAAKQPATAATLTDQTQQATAPFPGTTADKSALQGSRQETTPAPSTTGTPSGASTGTAPAPASGRAVDYQAQIGLEVKDGDALSSATDRAQRIARDLGGYVVAVEYASSESGSASLTLRVPTAKVQDAIAQLTALGKITSQQVQIRDLQEQLDQLSRQITVLRGRIAHITALLASPDLTPERRAQLEAQRVQLQSALRGIRQQSAGVSQQAALATIQLTLTTNEKSAAPAPASRVRRTLDEAGRILAWEGVALLYGLVVIGPFALVGAAAWLGARTRKRAEERRLLARG